MEVTDLDMPGLKLLTPTVSHDNRGCFFETFRAAWLPTFSFVQDNQSSSAGGTLRGLHYQFERPQGKLVRVIVGEAFDVAVDMRRSSPTFGQWAGRTLSAENREMLWIPPGFAHGFLALSETAELVYKCTDYYVPGDECAVRWDDAEIGINWPLGSLRPILPEPILSEKDRTAPAFKDARHFD